MTATNAIKVRLAVMNFLEFAVWGAYLISMGMYLGTHGLGDFVFWFYTVQGLVSIIMPALMGIVADRWMPAQRTLALCHLLAGALMIVTGIIAGNQGDTLSFGLIFTTYTISVAFYMPTLGLSNSVAFNVLNQRNLDTVKHFPVIRVFGTVGFIVAELFVNFVSVGGQAIQFSAAQFNTSGIISLLLAVYCLTLPNCPANKSGNNRSLSEALGLKAFKLFKRREMAIFFIFSMLLGVSLQITNSYGSSFINFFSQLDEFSNGFLNGWWANNPTFLISISQCAEALCILMIPFCLKRFGIKGVMLIAMFAWVLRFGFFGIGDTNFPGVIWLLLSCIVYGVAFDFFNVSGGLYVDKQTDPAQRSAAQGLFMLMTNGIGASVGTFIAGKFVVNNLVYAPGETLTQQLNGWHTSWLIFAAYALVVGIAFWIIFRDNKKPDTREIVESGEDAVNAGGFVEEVAR